MNTNPESKRVMEKLIFIVGTILLVSVAFVTGLKIGERTCLTSPTTECGSPQNQEVSRGSDETETEQTEFYSVDYPADYFITRKDYQNFFVAEKRWKGEMGNVPQAGIEMYTNVISGSMSLREWLEGISNPNPPIGDSPPKSCTEFIAALRKSMPYHELKSDDCWYYGASDIQDTTLFGLPALQFTTQNVSSAAQHTIFKTQSKYGTTRLFDVLVTTTGMSDEQNKTTEAYDMILETFSLRKEQ